MSQVVGTGTTAAAQSTTQKKEIAVEYKIKLNLNAAGPSTRTPFS